MTAQEARTTTQPELRPSVEKVETVVIGGGQAGLSVGTSPPPASSELPRPSAYAEVCLCWRTAGSSKPPT